MKHRNKLISIFVSLSVILSSLCIDELPQAYAETNGNSSQSTSVSEITVKFGKTVIDGVVTRVDDTFEIALPDTATKPAIYAKGTSNAYFRIKNSEGVKQGPKNIAQILTDKIDLYGSGISNLVSPSVFSIGQKAIATLQVGEFDEEHNIVSGSTYTLNLIKKVMLNSIALESEGISLSPVEEFNKVIAQPYSYVLPQDAKTITLTCTPKTTLAATDEEGNITTAGTYLKYGNAEDAMNSTDIRNDGATFRISDLPKDENGISYIPLTLAYTDPSKQDAEKNVQSSIYQLKLLNEAYYPTLELENTETKYEYDREAENVIPLKIINVTSSKLGTISYQWQVKKPGIANFQNLTDSGATTSEYTPSTANVYPLEYRCLVTNTVDGIKYIAASDSISVTILPTTASKPIITEISDTLECYRGEDKTIICSARSLDYKASLTFEWYNADTN